MTYKEELKEIVKDLEKIKEIIDKGIQKDNEAFEKLIKDVEKAKEFEVDIHDVNDNPSLWCR